MIYAGYSELGKILYVSWNCKNLLLTPVHAWMDAQLHKGLDQEVGSSLDDECSVNRVFDKVTWFIPCMIWGRNGTSIRSVGGGKGWVVGWVCRRGFCGFFFCKRCVAGVFWWNLNGAGKWVWTQITRWIFPGSCWMDLSWVMWKDVWLIFLNGPWLGDTEVCFVGDFEWIPDGWSGRIFGWKLWWWGTRVIRWMFSRAVRKMMSLCQMDESGVRLCADRVLCGLGG